MSHTVKVTGVFPQSIADHFALHADRLYSDWRPVMAICEFTPFERVQRRPNPNPDIKEQDEPVVLQITGLEIASRAQEEHLQEVQRAMFRIRTGGGTIDELLVGEHERTLELAGAVLLGQQGGRG